MAAADPGAMGSTHQALALHRRLASGGDASSVAADALLQAVLGG